MVSAFPSRGRDGSIAITALNCDGHADNRGRSMIFNDIGAGQGCRMSITTLVAAASARRDGIDSIMMIMMIMITGTRLGQW
jgi:hypothetical protein